MLMLKRIIFLVLLILINCGVFSTEAEVVITKTGVQIKGKIKSLGTRNLILQTRTREVSLPTQNIKRILSDSGRILNRRQLELTIKNNQIQAKNVISKKSRVQKGAKQRKKYSKKKKSTPVVELYMTTWCPYCQKMEKFLKQNKIVYNKFNIETDSKAKSRYKKYGGKGVPLLKIGSKIIKGYNPQGVKSALQ